MKTIKMWFVFLFLSVAACNQTGQSRIDSDLNAYFKEQMETYHLSALSAAMIKENKIIWTDAFGLTNLESGQPVDTNTLFHQGSISKTITLAAFLHLREKKKINLDDDINRYLPFEVRNPYHESEPITFSMLLTHTSGLNDVNVSQKNNKLASLYGNRDMTDLLESTLKNLLTEEGAYFDRDLFLKNKPGAAYAYSNLAFSLLGYLVDHISKVSFSEYCRHHIFRPLEMHRSTFLLSETDTSNFAYQYYSHPENPVNKFKIQPYSWPGYMDGSLRTSAREYANFLIMLINGGMFRGKRVLSEKTVETIFTIRDLPGKQSARMFQPAGRALIWNRVKDGNLDFYHFNGFGGGFFTEAYISPETQIAGVIFTTGGFNSFDDLGRFTEETVAKMIESTR